MSLSTIAQMCRRLYKSNISIMKTGLRGTITQCCFKFYYVSHAYDIENVITFLRHDSNLFISLIRMFTRDISF